MQSFTSQINGGPARVTYTHRSLEDGKWRNEDC